MNFATFKVFNCLIVGIWICTIEILARKEEIQRLDNFPGQVEGSFDSGLRCQSTQAQ